MPRRLLLRGAPFGGHLGQRAPGGLGVRLAPGDEHLDHAVHQVLAQHGGAGQVGVHIHGDGLALAQRVDQRQRLQRAAPVGGAGAFVVRDHQRQAGLEGAVARFVQGLDDGLHLAAQVRGVHAAVAGGHARQLGHFVGRRGHGLVVEQARGQAEGAVLHAGVQQLRHAGALIGAGGARQVVAHGSKAQRGVAHQRRHVERRARGLHGGAVGGHAGVLEGVGPQQRQRRARLRGAVRRQRDAAVAGDHRGDALRELGQVFGRAQHGGVVVCARR
jgi:hypothetical protein